MQLIFIQDLIYGEPRSDYPQAKKRFLFDIVSNKRNSIDVDKFDYILRDCYNVGIKSCLDPTRLMTFSRVINDQICFNQKEAYNLYEVCIFHLFSSYFTQGTHSSNKCTLIESLLRLNT